MVIITEPFDGQIMYVVDWYGFHHSTNDLVKKYGYKSTIDWWNKEVHPWMRANCKGRWYWRGYNMDSAAHHNPQACGYAFEIKAEALLFKLVWHVDQYNPKMPLICSGIQSVP